MNIYFFLCEGNHILRTGDNAQLAALASVGVYHDGTFHFTHSCIFLQVYKLTSLQVYFSPSSFSAPLGEAGRGPMDYTSPYDKNSICLPTSFWLLQPATAGQARLLPYNSRWHVSSRFGACTHSLSDTTPQPSSLRIKHSPPPLPSACSSSASRWSSDLRRREQE